MLDDAAFLADRTARRRGVPGASAPNSSPTPTCTRRVDAVPDNDFLKLLVPCRRSWQARCALHLLTQCQLVASTRRPTRRTRLQMAIDCGSSFEAGEGAGVCRGRATFQCAAHRSGLDEEEVKWTGCRTNWVRSRGAFTKTRSRDSQWYLYTVSAPILLSDSDEFVSWYAILYTGGCKKKRNSF